MFSLTWPASMQIYWNKRKRLHKKGTQLPQDWFGTPTWPPFHCFGTPIWSPWRHVKTLYSHRAFLLTWPTSMQIYCNKRKHLHKKRVQLPQDWFGTPTWPPFHCFGTPIWPPWRHVKTLCMPNHILLIFGFTVSSKKVSIIRSFLEGFLSFLQ